MATQDESTCASAHSRKVAGEGGEVAALEWGALFEFLGSNHAFNVVHYLALVFRTDPHEMEDSNMKLKTVFCASVAVPLSQEKRLKVASTLGSTLGKSSIFVSLWPFLPYGKAQAWVLKMWMFAT